MIKPVVRSDRQFCQNSKIIISNWSGRLGNNLIQLSNALYICLKYSCELEYPEHPLLKKASFAFNDHPPEQYYLSFFYDYNDCRNVMPTLKERRHILQVYIRDLLNFDLDRQPQEDNPERLVLQIRSGDTFRNHIPIYVPPPMSYYTKIMDQYQDRQMVIVCEDLSNPCIEALADRYTNCTIQSSDLETDIRTIVNATNLVLSIGTFGFILAMLSRKIEKLYVNDIPRSIDDQGFFRQEELGLDFEVIRYRISNYIKYGDWKRTPEQMEQLFNHSPRDITLEFA